MTYFRYEAAGLLGRTCDDRANAFRMSVLAAVGLRSFQGLPALVADRLSRAQRGTLSFYPNEALIKSSPRMTIAFMDAFEPHGDLARVVVEIEYTALVHRRSAVEIDVVFPDRLLGMGKALGVDDGSRYGQLLFNLTPGNVSANLFDALAPVCTAYSLTEAAYDEPGADLRLDGIGHGRFPSTYMAL